MSVSSLVESFNQELRYEQEAFTKIQKRLKGIEPSLDSRYIRLLMGASKHQAKIQELTHVIATLRKKQYKDIIIRMGSKVKLVSTQLGKSIYVEAQHYIELVGKQFGELVTLNNSTFLIAGVY